MHIPTLSKLQSTRSIEKARERIRLRRNKLRAKAKEERDYESEYRAPSIVNLAATIQADRRDAAIMLRYMRATIREQQRNQEES
jgi:hypothetical protein